MTEHAIPEDASTKGDLTSQFAQPVDRVSGVWVGKRLSKMERLCIQSFLSNGHGFDLYTYGSVEGVPAGTNLLDAREILPDGYWQPFARRGALALYADWFRWELLYQRGGCYVDMDIVCLKPWIFSTEIVFGWQSIGVPCNAVLRFPPGHPAARHLAERCRHPNRFQAGDSVKRKVKKTYRFLLGNDRTRTGWGEVGGPAGFQEAVDQFGLSEFGMSFAAFYPVYYLNWMTLFDDSFSNEPNPFPASFAVHLWNENTRTRNGWSKDATFSPASVVERLKQRYRVC